jgi:hypothetical protein
MAEGDMYRRATPPALRLLRRRLDQIADRGIDRVRVALRGETVELSWESRQALLEECREFDWREGSPIAENLRTVVDAFEAVGTSRPVELGPEKTTLRMVLQSWGGEMPTDLRELLNALEADLGASADEMPPELRELLNALGGEVGGTVVIETASELLELLGTLEAHLGDTADEVPEFRETLKVLEADLDDAAGKST